MAAPGREYFEGVISVQNATPGGPATEGSAVEMDTSDARTMTMQVVGTYGVSALSIQVTNNGRNWVTLAGTGTVTRQTTGVATATVTAAEQDCYSIVCPGFSRMRVTALGAITGRAQITLRTTKN